jgi:hypothetical protein
LLKSIRNGAVRMKSLWMCTMTGEMCSRACEKCFCTPHCLPPEEDSHVSNPLASACFIAYAQMKLQTCHMSVAYGGSQHQHDMFCTCLCAAQWDSDMHASNKSAQAAPDIARRAGATVCIWINVHWEVSSLSISRASLWPAISVTIPFREKQTSAQRFWRWTWIFAAVLESPKPHQQLALPSLSLKPNVSTALQ